MDATYEAAWIHWPGPAQERPYTVEPDGVHDWPRKSSEGGSLMTLVTQFLQQGWQIVSVIHLDNSGGREIWLQRATS